MRFTVDLSGRLAVVGFQDAGASARSSGMALVTRSRRIGSVLLAVGTALIACSSGGGGGLLPDAGLEDARVNDGGGDDARVDGCPAKMPQSGAACSASTEKKACSYGCDNGGPGSATCSGGKWNVQPSDQACPPPPADGPFACGNAACAANQYCVQPCCGGPAPQCTPVPDSGVCPGGTSLGSCPGTGTTGCVEGPCTPAPPYCIDTPTAPAGCTLEGSSRRFVCACA